MADDVAFAISFFACFRKAFRSFKIAGRRRDVLCKPMVTELLVFNTRDVAIFVSVHHERIVAQVMRHHDAGYRDAKSRAVMGV